MVDRYWRKIESVENNIENAMQISGILLKLKGYDKKLEGLSKITTNEGKISSNLGKITTNEGNISSNLGKITTNEGNISSNLEKIDNIKEFLISEDFKKLLILKDKYLDLIELDIFILFLKKRSYMISLKIVYYL